MFVTFSSFHHNLIFGGKTGGLNVKVRKFVNYGQKSFITLAPGWKWWQWQTLQLTKCQRVLLSNTLGFLSLIILDTAALQINGDSIFFFRKSFSNWNPQHFSVNIIVISFSWRYDYKSNAICFKPNEVKIEF